MAQKLFSEKNLYNFTTPFDAGADGENRQTTLLCYPLFWAPFVVVGEGTK